MQIQVFLEALSKYDPKDRQIFSDILVKYIQEDGHVYDQDKDPQSRFFGKIPFIYAAELGYADIFLMLCGIEPNRTEFGRLLENTYPPLIEKPIEYAIEQANMDMLKKVFLLVPGSQKNSIIEKAKILISREKTKESKDPNLTAIHRTYDDMTAWLNEIQAEPQKLTVMPAVTLAPVSPTPSVPSVPVQKTRTLAPQSTSVNNTSQPMPKPSGTSASRLPAFAGLLEDLLETVRNYKQGDEKTMLELFDAQLKHYIKIRGNLTFKGKSGDTILSLIVKSGPSHLALLSHFLCESGITRAQIETSNVLEMALNSQYEEATELLLAKMNNTSQLNPAASVFIPASAMPPKSGSTPTKPPVVVSCPSPVMPKSNLSKPAVVTPPPQQRQPQQMSQAAPARAVPTTVIHMPALASSVASIVVPPGINTMVISGTQYWRLGTEPLFFNLIEYISNYKENKNTPDDSIARFEGMLVQYLSKGGDINKAVGYKRVLNNGAFAYQADELSATIKKDMPNLDVAKGCTLLTHAVMCASFSESKVHLEFLKVVLKHVSPEQIELKDATKNTALGIAIKLKEEATRSNLTQEVNRIIEIINLLNKKSDEKLKPTSSASSTKKPS